MMHKFTTFLKKVYFGYKQTIVLRTYTLGIMMACIIPCSAQKTRSSDAMIHTPQIKILGSWNTLPILTLNGEQHLEFSFDDLSEDPQRYFYRIEHCDEHFRPTENLFESAYLQATDNSQLIEDYEPSRNTTVNYYHYKFCIPNANMKMLISGNYRLTIERDDEERTPVIESYFMILDQKTLVKASITTNTDIDFNQHHQQLSIEVEHAKLHLHNPQQQIKCVVIKNRDWNSAIWLSPSTYSTGNSLKWMHSKELIFKAGNEWRKFENLSTSEPSLHTDYIIWNPETNHYDVQLYVDEPRKNYLFDKEHNGAFYIRNIDGYDNETESDYVNIRFTLDMPQLIGGDVYIDGAWATNTNRNTYRMAYNEEKQAYEGNILLKQGYYNYYYRSEGNNIEGDFYETENEYTILVYVNQPDKRYTQLVGLGRVHSGK